MGARRQDHRGLSRWPLLALFAFYACSSCATPASPQAGTDRPGAGAASCQAVAVSATPSAAPPSAFLPTLQDDAPLPQRAVRRLGTNRLWTNGYIYGLAFSRDGKTLTSVNYLGLVQRWETETGKEIDRFTPQGARFTQPFALSSDGGAIGVGERDAANGWRVGLWDISKKSQTARLKAGSAQRIRGMSLSAEGRIAIADSEGDIRYFAPGAASPTLSRRGTGGREGKVYSHEGAMDVTDEAGVTLSPDSAWIASIHGDGTVRVYSLPKGEQRHTLSSHVSAPVPAFSRDSARLVYFGEHGLRVIDLATGKEGDALPSGGCDFMLALAFSPDGGHVAASTDNRAVCVWDLKTGGAPRVRRVHGDRVEQLAFSHDGGLLASGGRDGAIHLWRFPSLEPSLPFARHLGRIDALALSPDGSRAATGGVDGAVFVWDLATGKALLRRENPHLYTKPWCDHPVEISRDGKRLYSSTTGGMLFAWDMETGREVFRFLAGNVSDFALSPDGKTLAAIDSWGGIALHDAATGALLREVSKQVAYSGFSVAFSPDGGLLASGSYDGPLSLWEVSSGKLIGTQQGKAYRFFFTPDGKRLAVNGHEKLTFYSLEKGFVLREESSVQAKSPSALSRDQRLLAVTTGNSTMELRERSSGKALATFAYQEGTENLFLSDAEFTPDGSLLVASYSDGTTLLWSVR